MSGVVKKKKIKIMTSNRNPSNLSSLDAKLDTLGRFQIKNKVNQTDFCENVHTGHPIKNNTFLHIKLYIEVLRPFWHYNKTAGSH